MKNTILNISRLWNPESLLYVKDTKYTALNHFRTCTVHEVHKKHDIEHFQSLCFTMKYTVLNSSDPAVEKCTGNAMLAFER